MNQQHLTEEQIQQYASGTPEHGAAIELHLAGCADCGRKVAEYRLLFTSLQEQPAPVFDFDVTALVMPQLPEATPAPVQQRAGYRWVIVLSLAFLLVPVFVFHSYLVNLIATPPAVLAWPILLAPVLLIVLKGYSMYRMYCRKIEALNIY